MPGMGEEEVCQTEGGEGRYQAGERRKGARLREERKVPGRGEGG